MKDEPESLDADVLGMLRSALPMTAVSEETRARILSTVEGRILSLPVRPASIAPAATAATGPAAWIAAHPWLSLSAAFVLGTATGAAISRPSTSTSTSTVTPAATPPLPATPTATATTTPTATSNVESVPVEMLPSAKPVAAPPIETGERLAAESAVLDIARAAVAAGDGERALQAVDRHAAAFPRGLLTEEREALGIRALSIAGRAVDARARATRFRARYPESLFLPGIEAATKGAP
jgi:hypothetical protein